MRAVSIQNLAPAAQPDLPRTLAWAEVGHVDFEGLTPDSNPAFARIEDGQVYVEITLDNGEHEQARLGLDGAGEGIGDYISLEFGCRVIVGKVGDSCHVILGRLHDGTCRMPDSVAGVQTGAVAAVPGNEAVIPAPAWRFVKLGPGQLLAIETQAGGDVLIHSAGSVEIAAGVTGRIHLNGAVSLGVGPSTPPVGATVGPAGTTVDGVPAVPHVPVPKGLTPPAPPATVVPFVGFEDSIIRAKDRIQSHILVDPEFWAWIIGVHSFPLLLAWLAALPVPVVDPPIAIHSEHGGLGGNGSQHTASD